MSEHDARQFQGLDDGGWDNDNYGQRRFQQLPGVVHHDSDTWRKEGDEWVLVEDADE